VEESSAKGKEERKVMLYSLCKDDISHYHDIISDAKGKEGSGGRGRYGLRRGACALMIGKKKEALKDEKNCAQPSHDWNAFVVLFGRAQ